MDQLPPKNGRLVDLDDVKYVSRLSTILVATIEEAKDRISQIEYIFCNQLYPNVQSKYKNSQEVYDEAKKLAEEGWKQKESDLLLRIENLERGEREITAENQSLKLEKDKLLAELKKMTKSAAELGNEQERISLLEEKLASKSVEVDEGMELSNRLIKMVQSKSTKIVEQSNQLKEYEEKTSGLVHKVEVLEGKVESLMQELGQKTEEIVRQKKVITEMEVGTVFPKSTRTNEEEVTKAEEEKKKLKEELKCLQKKMNELERNLDDKTREVEQGRFLQKELQEQVREQADTISLKSTREEFALGENERVKEQFLVKVRDLEEKLKELQNDSSRDVMATKIEELLEQIQSKDAELVDEKEKKRDLVDAYKRLKHQYNYLREKCCLVSENMLDQTKMKDGEDSLTDRKSPLISPDIKTKGLDNSTSPDDIKKVKIEDEFSDALENDAVRKVVPNARVQFPPPRPAASNCPPTVKYASISGVKRPASGWRETRPGQSKRGPDPHDDFLSTPLEKLRANNLSKVIKEEEAGDVDVRAETDANPPCDSSDDETQNMDVDHGPQKQNQDQGPGSTVAGKNGFKFVETVRKKAERENLKGVECKQCKKFYDAVLPEEGNNNQNLRCEHHEGVSRHRYRYAPPSTPDGFWNIGFESEM